MLSASESIRAGVEDYARWLSEARPAHVVHLCSLSARESAQQDDDHLPACGYVSVLALSQALARHSGSTAMPVTLSVVSSGIYEVSGQDVVFAAKALMLGPVRVLSQEHPQIKCRLVDLGSADACDERAGQLLAECLAPIEEGVVAHRGRQRWVPVYEELPAAATVTPALRQGGVYLITGGLGALGLRIARHLHLTTGARLVLTGRRPVPHSSEWPALVSADEELVTFDIGDEIGADIGQPPLRLNAEEIGEADEAAALEMQTLPITAEPALARLLDRFCVALLCECFGRAGVTLQSGEHYTLQSLAASLGVVARYMRFLEFMIGVLADEGVFLREGETLTVCAYQRASVAELKQEAIADFARRGRWCQRVVPGGQDATGRSRRRRASWPHAPCALRTGVGPASAALSWRNSRAATRAGSGWWQPLPHA
jgi:hypothetical protein